MFRLFSHQIRIPIRIGRRQGCVVRSWRRRRRDDVTGRRDRCLDGSAVLGNCQVSVEGVVVTLR